MKTALDRSHAVRAILVLALLAALLSGCGRKEGGGDSSASDFACREALTAALDSEGALDARARALIADATAGRIGLQPCLDELVVQSRDLVGLISTVADAPEPSDPDLKKACAETEQFLRDRVFQVESALGATTPAELQSFYNSRTADLGARREQLHGLLRQYER
ncbi:MAG: hypothetical protein KKF41_00745 [Actinobacteria bacterium]|nr:hypothetical protein [Actinomycetota bacterium]MBU1942772.1 hypothetical protein [Actinomycetota bacterium]MBU2686094.1 hypothetical protein [Actinomycetota bacterium]